MVSVLLSVYNGEKYLREAIDSVLNQTFTEFELIILDDGSTDGTESIVRSYSDERIVYCKLPHQGQGSALHYGQGVAKYDYIARMDADDICAETRLEKQVKFLDTHTDVDIVGTNVVSYFEPSGRKEYIVLPEYDIQIKEQLPRMCCLAHPSIMFRKRIIELSGGYDPENRIEDWDLYLRLINSAVFHNIQEPLLILRKHSNNLTSDQNCGVRKIPEEELIQKFYQGSIKSSISRKEKALANFNIGYFYYLRDNDKYKQYFRMAFSLHKLSFRYAYFIIVGIYLRPLVLFARRSKMIKLLKPLKKLDKNNFFFRNDF